MMKGNKDCQINFYGTIRGAQLSAKENVGSVGIAQAHMQRSGNKKGICLLTLGAVGLRTM